MSKQLTTLTEKQLTDAQRISSTVYSALNELASLYEDADRKQEEDVNSLMNEMFPFDVDVRELADDCKKWKDKISYKVWEERQARKIGENQVELYEVLKTLVNTGTFYNVSKDAMDKAKELINRIG